MFSPYIGITDFASRDEVLDMLKVFRQHRRPGSPRKLHVGVMMSYKTLTGMPSRWSNVYPQPERLREIFSINTLDLLNCLHYADYENSLKKDNFLLQAGLFQMFEVVKSCPLISAVQLDMVWPDPVIVSTVRHEFRGEIILQVGALAMERLGNDPERVAYKIESYEGAIDRVLFDRSGGQGIPLDADILLPYIRELKEKMPDLGDSQIGVAGGLRPSTLHLLRPLIKEFPMLSTDAQGGMRRSGNTQDPIDWDLARNYIIRSLEYLEG